MKLILPISFLAITGILFFFIINPFYGEAKQIKADVATYNLALTNSTELQKTRDSLLGTYKNIKKEDLDRLEHFLPNNIKNIELVLEIEKIANMHGMPVKNIRFDSSKIVTTPSNDTASSDNTVAAENDPDKELPYGIFPVDFVVDGDYDTFLAFLKDLELNLRLVDVKSIYFSVPQAAASVGGATIPSIYSYSFKINTYWLK